MALVLKRGLGTGTKNDGKPDRKQGSKYGHVNLDIYQELRTD